MEVFIILISAIFTAGIVVLILMYFGYIKDKDKDLEEINASMCMLFDKL